MGKILGSWSGMRKYLEEEMLAPCLRGRVRYRCTAYVGMDGCRVFEIVVDNETVKRFSWETVNSYFIENGCKKSTDASGVRAYWDGFWPLMESLPMTARTEYTDGEFCAALERYRNQAIRDSLLSEDPIERMFAVLDRRVGKRSLAPLREMLEEQPAWLRFFYRLRWEAEGI